MVDAAVLVRQYLMTQLELRAFLGSNSHDSIYASGDLPEGFDPALGPCIQIWRAGGKSHDEILQMVNARVHVRVWADKERYQVAADVYGMINDVLHGATNVALDDGFLMSALEAEGPQEATDPDVGWVFVDSSYAVIVRPN